MFKLILYLTPVAFQQKTFIKKDEVNKKNVVVLGHGWAGKEFVNNLDRKKYNITVVDKNDYFLETHKMCSSNPPIKKINEMNTFSTYLSNICPFFSNVIVNNPKYINDEVREIKPKCNSVLTNNKQINYDYLVFALGSEVNTFNIPGVEENCLFYKTYYDWNRLSVINNKDITIVGGGAVGIELAYKMKKQNNKVTIIEAMDILPGFSEKTKEKVKKDLYKKGILLETDTKVYSIEKNDVKFMYIDVDFKNSCYHDYCIWTAGIKPHSLKTYEVNNSHNIFMLGDNSNYKPYTGQKTKQEGKHLADYFNNNDNNISDGGFKMNYHLNGFKFNEICKIIHGDDMLFIEANTRCGLITFTIPSYVSYVINMFI